jgi:hypothetical protein
VVNTSAPVLIGAGFVSISEVRTSAILEPLKLRGKKLWRSGLLQRHDLRAEFHKNVPVGSEVISGEGRTDGQTT